MGVASQTSIAPTSLSPVQTHPNHLPTPYPIVGRDLLAATSTLKNLTIDGSGPQSTSNSCGQDPIGVYFNNAFGHLKNVTVSKIAQTSTDRRIAVRPPGRHRSVRGIRHGIVENAGDSSRVTRSPGYQKDGVACRDAKTPSAM